MVETEYGVYGNCLYHLWNFFDKSKIIPEFEVFLNFLNIFKMSIS